MGNKRILHVVTVSFSLPYFVGEQIEHFKAKGYTFFVAASPSEHFTKFVEQKKISKFELNISRKIDPLSDIVAIYRLYRFIKEQNIKIVIGHTPKGGMISMIASFLAKVKIRIYFRHGIMYETSVGFKRKLLRGVETLSGRLATKVVCVSRSILDFSHKERLSSASKNVLLGKGTCNGIDVNRYNMDNFPTSLKEQLKNRLGIPLTSFIYGFVGRIVKDKGIHELIRAWQLLLRTHKDIKLILIGPFEERDSVDEEIKSYIHNEPSIIYLGEVDNALNYYSLFDVFVLPSYREGFPTVVLEASAMQIPVITTKATGCIDSIIENETGIFSNNEPVELSQKMQFYYENLTIAREHGKNGRQFVENNYRQESIWREIEMKLLN